MDREREARSTEQRSWIDLPWGFFLVLAAITVVAAMYLVTMRSIPNIPPETAVGAMSGALALIGTLVGTYFGIKAGLDGQQKIKDARTRDDADRFRERLQVGTESNGDRRREGHQAEEQVLRRRDSEEQPQGWEGVGV